MIQDAIWLNGYYVAHQPLSERLRAIGTYVVAPYRFKFPTQESESLFPFILMGKEILEVSALSQIFTSSEYHVDNEGPRFIYHRNRRYNDTEGIYIIRDDLPPFSSNSVLKWIFPELNYVTFSLLVNDSDLEDNDPVFKVSLRIAPGNNELISYRNVHFTKNDAKDILIQLKGAKQANIGCRFDKDLSEWRFVHISNRLVSDMIEVLDHVEIVASSVSKTDLFGLHTYIQQIHQHAPNLSPDYSQSSPMNSTPEMGSISPPNITVSPKRERVDDQAITQETKKRKMDAITS